MARDFDLARLITDDGLTTSVNVDVSFDANTLYVAADTNRVGINTNAPGYTLEVNGSLNSTSLYLGGTQVTSTATELNLLDGVTATTAEINYLDGVTSNIQTQIDNISSSFIIAADSGANDTFSADETLTFTGGTGIDTTVADNQITIAIDSTVATLTGSQTLTNKTITSPSISDPTLTGTTTYATLNDGTTSLTATVAELNVLDGITATVTELNYTDGVTSAIQTQLDAKAPLASPALTGTATAVNLTLSGNLTVNGTTTTLNTTNTVVSDNLIELNNGVTSNANDSGIVIERGTTGDNAFMGWDESADTFVLGTTTATGSGTGDLTITPGTLNVGTLQIGGTSVTATAAELNILDGVTATASELNALDGITATVTELNYTDGVTSNIQTQLNAKLASSSYTAADVLSKLLTVDGAGSGLDADTLDGLSSASYARTTAVAAINMSNYNITNINALSFNDPGPAEGISWSGGNGWAIWESPNDLTTNSGGNLQIVQSSTRRATFNTSGQLEIPIATGTAPLSVSSTTVVTNLNADLLDGVQGSSYLRSDADDTFTNLTGSSIRLGTGYQIAIGSSAHQLNTPSGYIQLGPMNTTWAHIYTDRPNFYFNKELYVNNSKVWNAGNDGSGSGLDADLLDGQQGSYYLDYNNLTNKPSSGLATNSTTISSAITLSSGTNGMVTGPVTISATITIPTGSGFTVV